MLLKRDSTSEDSTAVVSECNTIAKSAGVRELGKLECFGSDVSKLNFSGLFEPW